MVFLDVVYNHFGPEGRFRQHRESYARGYFDAQWNDDAHHVLHVLLTGETSGYYAAYAENTVEKLARRLTEGFVYHGSRPPPSRRAARHAQRRLAAFRVRDVSEKSRSN